MQMDTTATFDCQLTVLWSDGSNIGTTVPYQIYNVRLPQALYTTEIVTDLSTSWFLVSDCFWATSSCNYPDCHTWIAGGYLYWYSDVPRYGPRFTVNGSFTASLNKLKTLAESSRSLATNWGSSPTRLYRVVSDQTISPGGENAAIVDSINSQTQHMDDLQQQAQQREDSAQETAQIDVSSAISDSQSTLSGPLQMMQAVENLGSSITDAFTSSDEYTFHFPGVSGPFMPDGSSVVIIAEQDVDLSYLREHFGVLLDAMGLVVLGLCGWKALDFIYHVLQEILMDREVEI